MDTIQESLNSMMGMFMKRMDNFEERQASAPSTPTTDGDTLACEFAEFKSFVLASFRALQTQIEVLAKQADQLEMRGRRKILLLHGVPEVPNENTNESVVKALVERLKLEKFTVGDISRSHRMGRTGSDKIRPILFKLRDVAVREQIWSSKTGLKGSGMTLSEFLTKTRHDVFMAARQRFGVTKCWTREGLVFVLGTDGSRHRLCSKADLEALSSKDKPKPAPAVRVTAAPVTAAPARSKRVVKK